MEVVSPKAHLGPEGNSYNKAPAPVVAPQKNPSGQAEVLGRIFYTQFGLLNFSGNIFP